MARIGPTGPPAADKRYPPRPFGPERTAPGLNEWLRIVTLLRGGFIRRTGFPNFWDTVLSWMAFAAVRGPKHRRSKARRRAGPPNLSVDPRPPRVPPHRNTARMSQSAPPLSAQTLLHQRRAGCSRLPGHDRPSMWTNALPASSCSGISTAVARPLFAASTTSASPISPCTGNFSSGAIREVQPIHQQMATHQRMTW